MINIDKQLLAILSDTYGDNVLSAIDSASTELEKDRDVDISAELKVIRTGVYGSDIRQAIHDILKKLSLADSGGGSEEAGGTKNGTVKALVVGNAVNTLYGTVTIIES